MLEEMEKKVEPDSVAAALHSWDFPDPVGYKVKYICDQAYEGSILN